MPESPFPELKDISSRHLIDRTGHRLGRVGAQGHDAIALIDVHHPGCVIGDLPVVQHLEGHDDDQVARIDQMRCRPPIDPDHPRSRPPPRDRVRGQARTVGDVHDVDLLALEDIGGSHQVLVDGDRSYVVQIGLGDGGAVHLAPQHGSEHMSLQQLLSQFAPDWQSATERRLT